jgi:hypothetical protein
MCVNKSQFVRSYLNHLVQQTGPHADYSPPDGAEIKNEWDIPLHPPYTFAACTGKNVTFQEHLRKTVDLCIAFLKIFRL